MTKEEHALFVEAFRNGDTEALNAIYNKQDEVKRELESTLKGLNDFTSKWVKDQKNYFILSPCTKQPNHMQLTYFINDTPISDKIREYSHDTDIINGLYDNNCILHSIIQ